MPKKTKTFVVALDEQAARAENSSAEATPTIADEPTASSIQPKPRESAAARKRRRRRKKMRIADALRREGLDERDVAKRLAVVLDRQTPAQTNDETNDKLVVDALMSCFRYLDDAPRPGGGGGAPVMVKLTHDVPRPQRTGKIQDEKEKGNQT